MVCEFDERSTLCRLGAGESPYFCQHRFLVQGQADLSDTSFESLASAPIELDFEALKGRRFAFQISANRRLDWSFGQLVPALIERFGLNLEDCDHRKPQTVVSLYIHISDQRVRLYSGISATVDNVSPWSRGICRIPKDPKAVSRAEQKLRESLELLEQARVLGPGEGQPKRALDLGAAPGGWSRVMAQLGYSVDAVDPADLDPRVAAHPGVTHHRTTSGAFLKSCRSRYHALLCDMKMEAVMATKVARDFQHFLEPSAVLVLTLKLPKGKTGLTVAHQAVEGIEKAYTIVQARQLYFNRHELTVLAVPRAG